MIKFSLIDINPMQTILIISTLLLYSTSIFSNPEKNDSMNDSREEQIKALWEACNLRETISLDVFSMAMNGYYNIEIEFLT